METKKANKVKKEEKPKEKVGKRIKKGKLQALL